jgi:hypothetical protein
MRGVIYLHSLYTLSLLGGQLKHRDSFTFNNSMVNGPSWEAHSHAWSSSPPSMEREVCRVQNSPPLIPYPKPIESKALSQKLFLLNMSS